MNATVRADGTNEPRIALVSFDSLGDALIYPMMADNLQRNGFKVTHYGGVHQIFHWRPGWGK
jgi:hypothetical protein